MQHPQVTLCCVLWWGFCITSRRLINFETMFYR